VAKPSRSPIRLRLGAIRSRGEIDSRCSSAAAPYPRVRSSPPFVAIPGVDHRKLRSLTLKCRAASSARGTSMATISPGACTMESLTSSMGLSVQKSSVGATLPRPRLSNGSSAQLRGSRFSRREPIGISSNPMRFRARVSQSRRKVQKILNAVYETSLCGRELLIHPLGKTQVPTRHNPSPKAALPKKNCCTSLDLLKCKNLYDTSCPVVAPRLSRIPRIVTRFGQGGHYSRSTKRGDPTTPSPEGDHCDGTPRVAGSRSDAPCFP
jgi:hypothetical protein